MYRLTFFFLVDTWHMFENMYIYIQHSRPAIMYISMLILFCLPKMLIVLRTTNVYELQKKSRSKDVVRGLKVGLVYTFNLRAIYRDNIK